MTIGGKQFGLNLDVEWGTYSFTFAPFNVNTAYAITQLNPKSYKMSLASILGNLSATMVNNFYLRANVVNTNNTVESKSVSLRVELSHSDLSIVDWWVGSGYINKIDSTVNNVVSIANGGSVDVFPYLMLSYPGPIGAQTYTIKLYVYANRRATGNDYITLTQTVSVNWVSPGN